MCIQLMMMCIQLMMNDEWMWKAINMEERLRI